MPFGLPSPLELVKKIKGELLGSPEPDDSNSSSHFRHNNYAMRSSSQDSVASLTSNNNRSNFLNHHHPGNNYSARPSTSHGRRTPCTPVNTNPSYRQQQQHLFLSKSLTDTSLLVDDSHVVEIDVYPYADSMPNTVSENQEENELKARRERDGKNNHNNGHHPGGTNKRKSQHPRKRTLPQNKTMQPLDEALWNQQQQQQGGGNYHAPKKVPNKQKVIYPGGQFPPPGEAFLNGNKQQEERNQLQQRRKQPPDDDKSIAAMDKVVNGWLNIDCGDMLTGNNHSNTKSDGPEDGSSNSKKKKNDRQIVAVMNSPSDPIPRRKKKYDESCSIGTIFCVNICDGENSATDDDEHKPPATTTTTTTKVREKTPGPRKPFEQRTKGPRIEMKSSSSMGMTEKLFFSKRTGFQKKKRSSPFTFQYSSDEEDSHRGNKIRDLVDSISQEVAHRDSFAIPDATSRLRDNMDSRSSNNNNSSEEIWGNHDIALKLHKRQDTFGRQESTAKKRKIGRKIPIPAFLETGGSQRSRSSSRASRDEGGTASGERPSKAAERMLLTDSEVRRSSRISAQKKKPYGGTADLAIDILSSEDESIAEVSAPSHGLPKSVLVVTMDAIRIAIGKKVFHNYCKIDFDADRGYLKISYRQDEERLASPDRESATHNIDLISDLQEMKFHIESESDGEEDLSSFLALNVKKSNTNGLTKLSNCYKPDCSDPSKRYIVIEFRNDDDFRKLLDLFRSHKYTEALVNSLEELPARQAKEYCQALFEDSEKAKKRRFRVSLSCERTGFLEGKVDTDVLLHYPFDYHDQTFIDLQAKGLRYELSEVIGVPSVNENLCESTVLMNDFGPQGDSESALAIKKSRFSLQVTVADFERLEPGEYLNDTLIDFWLHWIWRNAYQAHVHVFSTQFYTALVEGGPQAVVHWTKNRGIDIFKKKFIFIPINKDFHWSLAVIVNPGRILHHNQIFENMHSTEDHETTLTDKVKKKSFPFFLFFDSLKAHRKDRVANTLMEWLNAEWARMNPDGPTSPFKKPCMQICSPDVPQQDNGCDCGVFVCRYAYAVKKLSHLDFTYKETDFHFSSRQSRNFCKSIFSNPFNFGMDDIAAIREDLKSLIHRLSDIFIPWKKEQQRKEKVERLQKRIHSKEKPIDKSNFNAKSCSSQNSRQRGDDDEAGLTRKVGASDVELSERAFYPSEKTESISLMLSGASESVASTCSPLQQLHAIHDLPFPAHEEVEPDSMDWEDETQV